MLNKFPFTGSEGSRVSAEYYTGTSSVMMHYHDFYELVLVHRGSCMYKYQNGEMLLVAGDVFLIPPGSAHGYEYDTTMEFYNCQFYLDKLGGHWKEFLDEVSFDDMKGKTSLNYDLCDVTFSPGENGAENDSKPTVIHLNISEQDNMEQILMRISKEEKERKTGFKHAKASYLSIMLTELKRIQEERDSALNLQMPYEKRKSKIAKAIEYINENYTESFDFSKLANDFGFSPGHFRELFKKATGLTPKDYLNRLRIAKSLEFIRREGLSISEAAGRVGIYDANYFSRLFKKIIGHSPKYFKNIAK